MNDRTDKLLNETEYSETEPRISFEQSEMMYQDKNIVVEDEIQEEYLSEDGAPEELNQEEDPDEQRRRDARLQRRERMRKEKERQLLIRRLTFIILPIACVLFAVILLSGRKAGDKQSGQEQAAETQIEPVTSTEIAINETDKNDAEVAEQGDMPANGIENGLQGSTAEDKLFSASFGDNVQQISEEDVESTYAIVVDIDQGQVLAAREAQTRISPASMTKILTVLVAAEHIDNLSDKVSITIDVTDYAFANDCSTVGFSQDEVVNVRDLMYGTILPSGADAAVALAKYVAGSHEAFVDMMNEKLESMGLSDTTHFTNCVGLYDDDHYSTVYDMAMILQAAVENDLCRDVLKAHTFTTSGTEDHPNGITISNWFLRRIEDKPVPGEVLCAKTGFVVQSRNCAASYGISNSGKGIICVTADAHSSWRAIYDHVALYNAFM